MTPLKGDYYDKRNKQAIRYFYNWTLFNENLNR